MSSNYTLEENVRFLHKPEARTKRIDFILSSHNLLPYIKKVRYTAFYDASGSDHRAAFIELSNDVIDNKIELKQPNKREIGSKSKKCDIYEYKQDIYKEFIKQNIYKEVDILYKLTKQNNYDEQYLTKKLNNID
jgi:vacuolar-type H+-ATPase catalytic subunit A/Vma1